MVQDVIQNGNMKHQKEEYNNYHYNYDDFDQN